MSTSGQTAGLHQKPVPGERSKVCAFLDASGAG